MNQSNPDPLWAVRLVKRVAKALALLVVVFVACAVVWTLLPVAPAVLELRLTSNAEATLGGMSLGTGEIVIGDQTLREHGALVGAGTELQAIAEQLFPGEEFRGEVGHQPSTLPALATGAQCHLHSGASWRVVRIFVFPATKNQWLAVPVAFHDKRNGRVHTECPDWRTDQGWSLLRSFEKVPHHAKIATIHSTDRKPPGEGQFTIAPITLKLN